MQKTAKILDKILFRMIPGVCFLVFFWRMIDSIDTGFRTQNDSIGILFTTVALIVFSANLIIWILLDDVILEPKDTAEKPDTRLVLLKNCALFLITFGIVFFSNPGSAFSQIYDSFVRSGALYYGAIMTGDVLYMLGDTLSNIKAAGSIKARIGWIVLLCYLVLLCGVVEYTFMKVLEFNETVSASILFVFVPFILTAFYRFRGHMKV